MAAASDTVYRCSSQVPAMADDFGRCDPQTLVQTSIGVRNDSPPVVRDPSSSSSQSPLRKSIRYLMSLRHKSQRQHTMADKDGSPRLFSRRRSSANISWDISSEPMSPPESEVSDESGKASRLSKRRSFANIMSGLASMRSHKRTQGENVQEKTCIRESKSASHFKDEAVPQDTSPSRLNRRRSIGNIWGSISGKGTQKRAIVLEETITVQDAENDSPAPVSSPQMIQASIDSIVAKMIENHHMGTSSPFEFESDEMKVWDTMIMGSRTLQELPPSQVLKSIPSMESFGRRNAAVERILEKSLQVRGLSEKASVECLSSTTTKVVFPKTVNLGAHTEIFEDQREALIAVCEYKLGELSHFITFDPDTRTIFAHALESSVPNPEVLRQAGLQFMWLPSAATTCEIDLTGFDNFDNDAEADLTRENQVVKPTKTWAKLDHPGPSAVSLRGIQNQQEEAKRLVLASVRKYRSFRGHSNSECSSYEVTSAQDSEDGDHSECSTSEGTNSEVDNSECSEYEGTSSEVDDYECSTSERPIRDYGVTLKTRHWRQRGFQFSGDGCMGGSCGPHRPGHQLNYKGPKFRHHTRNNGRPRNMGGKIPLQFGNGGRSGTPTVVNRDDEPMASQHHTKSSTVSGFEFTRYAEQLSGEIMPDAGSGSTG